MFETVELGRTLNKEEYQAELPKLRKKILSTQFAFNKENRFPFIIIVEGVDNVIKGEVINRLNEWLDARSLQVQAFTAKSDEEAERPRFWRYWRALPAKGEIGLFATSWYTGPLIQQAFKKIDKQSFDAHLHRIAAFEEMLAKDGALIIKLWLHLSAHSQETRFKQLAKQENSRWQISGLDQNLHANHHRFTKAAERAVRLTDTPSTPWIIVEAEDPYYRDMHIGKVLLKALQKHLKHTPQIPPTMVLPESDDRNILAHIDLSQRLDKSQYNALLEQYQAQLNHLSWRAYHAGISMVLLFEGWDAAGKGGAIRRVTQAIDARIARVISVAAPTDEEKGHHYLWRFWRHMPRAGRVTIYDRSWYGRVLVERIESFAETGEWQRAYGEINEFEEQLHDHQVLLLKFWLHIDPQEQLKRFKEREKVAYKRHKLTEEDWRNRDKWQDYEQAVDDMIRKTSTDYAPWHLIAANNKRFARIAILQHVCDKLSNAINQKEKAK